MSNKNIFGLVFVVEKKVFMVHKTRYICAKYNSFGLFGFNCLFLINATQIINIKSQIKKQTKVVNVDDFA